MNSASCSNHDAAHLRQETPDYLDSTNIFVAWRSPGTIAETNRSLRLIRPQGRIEDRARQSLPIAGSLGRPANTPAATGAIQMSNDNSLSRPELDDRIAILQGNLGELVEQAAGRSGGQTEERNADRIAQQREDLDRLTKERDALLKA
jgi:hypothetical protein